MKYNIHDFVFLNIMLAFWKYSHKKVKKKKCTLKLSKKVSKWSLKVFIRAGIWVLWRRCPVLRLAHHLAGDSPSVPSTVTEHSISTLILCVRSQDRVLGAAFVAAGCACSVSVYSSRVLANIWPKILLCSVIWYRGAILKRAKSHVNSLYNFLWKKSLSFSP